MKSEGFKACRVRSAACSGDRIIPWTEQILSCGNLLGSYIGAVGETQITLRFPTNVICDFQRFYFHIAFASHRHRPNDTLPKLDSAHGVSAVMEDCFTRHPRT